MDLNKPLGMSLQVLRTPEKQQTVIKFGDLCVGGHGKVIMAGPCAVESYTQLDTVASFLKQYGVQVLRGGAYKPRTSPYSFQGLRKQGVKILHEVATKHSMLSISEMLDTSFRSLFEKYIDIIQIGSRNMQNFELLKLVGKMNKPVFLKRGFMATLEEYLYAAEYIMLQGNSQVMLCERGIRTFETYTRNTLDLAGMVLLKKYTHLPVIVDVSHSLGRKDIISEVTKAVLAAGADGIMIEVHNNPAVAKSDKFQQLSLDEFVGFRQEIAKFV